jgi:hypothetical protein
MAMVEPNWHRGEPGTSFARCGEVVAAQVSEFEAQCDQLHASPPLGALVRVTASEEFTILGLVAGITTGGVESGMRPIPRGRDGCEDSEIFRAHPDLAHLLATCVRCLVVGFRRGPQVHHFLPSFPAPIHYSVAACSPTEVAEFTRDFDYFPTLVTARDLPIEEALAAHVRYAAEARDRATSAAEPPYDFTIRAGRALTQLLRGDHQRLSTILQRIRRPQGSAATRGAVAREPMAQSPAP